MEGRARPAPAAAPRFAWRPRAVRCGLLLLGVALALPSGGCYTRRMKRMESHLDTLRVQVDSLQRTQDVTLRQIRSDLSEQREMLHSVRAGTNVASQELVDRIGELSAKLDDTVDRVIRLQARGGPPPAIGAPATPGDTTQAPHPGVDANTLYEQGARDFTQGRFELALGTFRQLLAAYPADELADNALYGVGESFYALARFDSAEVAYRQVEERYPRGDRVPAALYKLGMVYQKLGRDREAKETFTRLRQRFPRSGEATLAEERLRELER